MNGINTYHETALHHALKTWYSQPGDQLEAQHEGYVIDVLRDDLLIEIQTSNFSAMRPKLSALLDSNLIRIVHPIAMQRHIIKQYASGCINRRKSPKKGHITHLFGELVYLKTYWLHRNLSLHVLMVEDEELRIEDGKGSWRRKGWSIADRQLLKVHEDHLFDVMTDVARLLPEDLPVVFTTRDLASRLSQSMRVAQQMTYCLREMCQIEQIGKQGNAKVYRINPSA